MRLPLRNPFWSRPDYADSIFGGPDPVAKSTIMPPDTAPTWPVVEQEDLIKGTKYAQLYIDEAGEAYFTGVGMRDHRYTTESYAVCAKGKDHDVPDPLCTCGFWVPLREQSALSRWSADTVALEVEMGGRVWEFGKDPLPAPPWGWRAQWQRVLSVTLPKECAVGDVIGGPCIGDPSFLVVWIADTHRRGADRGRVLTACYRHAMLDAVQVIDKPVSWLRRSLRTEIRPGLVEDDDGRKWREAIAKVGRVLCPMSMLEEVAPEDPEPGQHFRVCADVREHLVYELCFDGEVWQIEHIYHPHMGPWGWGEPE